ncbi:MAG: phosphoribosyl isomerase [Actinomycetota bacterium]
MNDLIDVTPKPPFAIFAAIDISHGCCRRITAGSIDADDYGDPVEVAQSLVASGARLLHLVDLDQAFERGNNREVMAEVVAAAGVPVQISGGINSTDRLKSAFDAGAIWVNLSADALLEPAWLAESFDRHLGRLSVSIDVTPEQQVVARGSNIEVGFLPDLLHLVHDYRLGRVIVTDTTADGAMSGPNLNLAATVAAATNAHVIASGGIRDASDIKQLADMREIGVIGAVVGKALYQGSLTIEQAHDAAALRRQQ